MKIVFRTHTYDGKSTYDWHYDTKQLLKKDELANADIFVDDTKITILLKSMFKSVKFKLMSEPNCPEVFTDCFYFKNPADEAHFRLWGHEGIDI